MEWRVVLLALADSINPCTIAVMALFLATLLMKRGKAQALLGGLLFVATVYLIYLLYGLGLLAFITTTNILNVLRGVTLPLILLLAVWELMAFVFYRPGLTSLEMPLSLRPLVKKIIEGVESPFLAPLIAAICSLLLLPCSSGPYLAALPLMGGLLDLFLYVFIFVLPMAVIVGLLALGVPPQLVKEMRDRYARLFHLISGVLLLLVLLYLFPSPSKKTVPCDVLVLLDPHCPHCQHLKEVLTELNICYREISRDEARRLAAERGVEWDGGVPLVIYRDKVFYGFPAAWQDINGYFSNEEEMCRALGRPVYRENKYLYCVLRNGAILGNRRVLEMFVLRSG